MTLLRPFFTPVSQLDLEPLKRECDRKWENEPPQHVINIAASAIHWQKREIAEWRGKYEALAAPVTPVSHGPICDGCGAGPMLNRGGFYDCFACGHNREKSTHSMQPETQAEPPE